MNAVEQTIETVETVWNCMRVETVETVWKI